MTATLTDDPRVEVLRLYRAERIHSRTQYLAMSLLRSDYASNVA